MVKLVMKNSFVTVRDKMVSKYLQKNNNDENEIKSTDINVLLNRVKLDQKKESRKKLLFSAAASAGVVLFGVLIF
tara:strand:+ start:171 stop:395 length:225 start_codon:yes stop_codon:yes gene_type:complete